MPSSSLKDVINSGNLNQLADACQKLHLGDLVSYLISKLIPTEAGVGVVADVATLAAVPTALFQVVGITGAAVRTTKKLRQGPITGAGAIVPASGECVWDGGLHILFAAVDVAATCDVVYAVATTDKSSIGLADLPSGSSTI